MSSDGILAHIEQLTAFWRLVFWLGTAAVTALSLLPQDALPPLPDINDKIEHAGAYVMLALVAGPAWPRFDAHARIAVALIVLGGAIEIAQLWIPGRSAEWGDFAADILGVLAGFTVFRIRARRSARV